MSNADPTESDIARLRDASEWILRLNESTAQALTDQWLQWCRSDQRNLLAFEQMQRTWDAFPAERNISFRSSRTVARIKYRYRAATLAAGIVLLFGMAGWFGSHYPEVQVLDTPVGEQRRITLADGSIVDLAPDSHVSTRFTFSRRDVLLEHGQAFFAVAHSAKRPFIVHTNGLTVRAEGTAFDVQMGPSSTVVTVSEGFVNLAPSANEAGGNGKVGSETIRAGVGQRVEFSRISRRSRFATVNPKVAGSWRSGTLQFMADPLEDVVSAVNRYSATQIVVAPEFRQTRFTGTLSPTDIRDWLKALEQIYAVEVVAQGTSGILIQSRAYDVAPK
jgi:transmembrane sensor